MFYDAWAENGSAKEVMKSDTLRLMAREVAEMVTKMPKLDWTQREYVRARLRRSVRRLLAKYGYHPILRKTLPSSRFGRLRWLGFFGRGDKWTDCCTFPLWKEQIRCEDRDETIPRRSRPG